MTEPRGVASYLYHAPHRSHTVPVPHAPCMCTGWPCYTTTLCLYPSRSNRKTGGKNQAPVLQANSFPYPLKDFLRYTWQPCQSHCPEPIPISPACPNAGVGQDISASPPCPTVSRVLPSIPGFWQEACMPLFGCAKLRRAQTTGWQRAHPFGGHRQSQENGVLWTVRPIYNSMWLQLNRSLLPLLIEHFHSPHKVHGQM